MAASAILDQHPGRRDALAAIETHHGHGHAPGGTTHAPSGEAPADLSFLNGGAQLDQPLPGGLVADPTYLAFLRGQGLDQKTAWATAVKQVAAIHAQYQTDVSRDPQVLHDAIRGVNATYSGNGTWFSGGRLEDVAQKRVEDQQRLQDLATQQATGVAGVQSDLQNQLQGLARNNADEIANLQGRRDEQTNQDQYIRAVGAANAEQSAMGGARTDPLAASLAGGTNPATGPATTHADIAQRLSSMSPDQQAAFRQWVSTQPHPLPAVAKPAAPKPVGYQDPAASVWGRGG